MPPNYDYTEIENADENIEEIAFMPSTLENIDRAMFAFAEGELDPPRQYKQRLEKSSYPLGFPLKGLSRSRQIKISETQTGVLKLPLMTVERTSVEKDPGFKGTFQAHVPDSGDVRRITIPAGKNNPARKKHQNFRNAFSARRSGTSGSPSVGHGQLNFPSLKANNTRVVFQTKYLPIPVYVKVMYSLKIRTEYLQQMNDIFQPFITKTGQMNNFFITHEGHRYEGFIEGSFGQNNNVSELGEEERSYETEIQLKILGYLMGEGANDKKPKISIEETIVDVKIPREKVMVGDINTFLGKNDKGKGFYRE